MKKRLVTGGIAIISLVFGYGQVAGQRQDSSRSAPPAASAQRALLDQYCVTCHNQKMKTAGLMLDKLDLAHAADNAEVWEKVVRKLRAGAMPPANMPHPAKASSDSLVAWLEAELAGAAAAKPNPGRPIIHRLNRAEYSNAIRDLLALDADAMDIKSLLPGDDAGYGFDNIGDVLSVSPALLERYMLAAERISRIAVGDPAIRSVADTYNVPKNLLQDDRISEDLPFGSRGGLAIRHHFPLNGEYVIQVSLRQDVVSYLAIGLDQERQIDVRLDGERIQLLTVGGSKTRVDPVADPALRVRLAVKAGSRLVGINFVRDMVAPEGRRQESSGIGSITIMGPYDATGPGETANRSRIFVCRPAGRSDEACAEKILSTLARRAYRRPVNDADIQPLLALYQDVQSSEGFEAGIQMALRGILVSPGFLFRFERDPAKVVPNTAYRIGDVELASRLSFFLWSSIPDDALLDLAEGGKLKDPAVLEQQVRRMLADPRSKALVENFAGQWLWLRKMPTVTPDPEEFSEFDDNLRQAMEQETKLFLESMLREDRSVLDLFRADYTFVNERLAQHYQIPNVFGSDFRRVKLSDENRRGLLGQGSILTVTSYPTRTSPTVRGKWLLENILGSPPPPPPPNVPSLLDDKQDKVLSMRERMEAHRKNPVCAGCHAQIDPMGFAMENFDAIGRWRTTSGAAKTPIDSSALLPDGTKFRGPAELQKVLLSHHGQFIFNLTEKLLTYALGRGAEYYDGPAIRTIEQYAARSDYRWSSLILGIVKSAPFQMRRSQKS